MNTTENTAENGIAISKFGGSFATDPETGLINWLYFKSYFQNNRRELIKYRKLGFTIGGGQKVRDEQRNIRNLRDKDLAARDRMWENAEGIRQIANDYAGLSVAETVPHNVDELMQLTQDPKKNAVSASWTQEGWDSSYTAVLMLKGFLDALKETDDQEEIEILVMFLSNLDYMGKKDPRLYPSTKLVKMSSFDLLLKAKIISADVEKYSPGAHVPIGPHAVRDLHELEQERQKMTILYTHGYNLLGVKSALRGEIPERGTILTPGISRTVWKKNDIAVPAKS